MPLEKGKSRAAFQHNVRTEMKSGKPQRQAVAIAYRESGEKRGKDALAKAIAAGEREAEAQRQAKAMLDGKSVSGRDRGEGAAMKLYDSPEERSHALVIGAAVAVHAIVSGAQFAHTLDTEEGRADVVNRAFDLAEKFLAEAERRIGS